MSDDRVIRTTRLSKRSDPKTLARFIEELSWLLNTYSDLDFRALDHFVHAKPVTVSRPRTQRVSRKLPRNPNIHLLVGMLPGMFVDERLFPTNEDIAEFASSALGVVIPRWQKKSKFELIGHIVCTANGLKDNALENLVSALTEVTGEEETRKAIESKRQQGLSWNEVIQTLLKDRRGS